MKHSRPGAAQGGYASYAWNGRPIHYRPGTSDCKIIYEILLKRGRKGEYWLPSGLSPRTILDIGGNIGITAVYLANRFPDATIHVFEPIPANFELLERNVAPYPRIHAHAVALGGQDGELDMFASDHTDNYGGFSLFERGVDSSKRTKVLVRHAQSYLDEKNIPQPDLIKIDTEGSEYEILTALRPELIERVQWIIGELHAERDFELLAYLSKWFDIGAKKSIGKRLFMFNACNKTVLDRVRA